MGEVYSRASTVLIWLGLESDSFRNPQPDERQIFPAMDELPRKIEASCLLSSGERRSSDSAPSLLGNGFDEADNLQRNSKALTCEQCHRTFPRPYKQRRHIETQHAGTQPINHQQHDGRTGDISGTGLPHISQITKLLRHVKDWIASSDPPERMSSDPNAMSGQRSRKWPSYEQAILLTPEHHEVMHMFFAREWFQCSWVVQEAILPAAAMRSIGGYGCEPATMHHGAASITARTLSDCDVTSRAGQDAADECGDIREVPVQPKRILSTDCERQMPLDPLSRLDFFDICRISNTTDSIRVYGKVSGKSSPTGRFQVSCPQSVLKSTAPWAPTDLQAVEKRHKVDMLEVKSGDAEELTSWVPLWEAEAEGNESNGSSVDGEHAWGGNKSNSPLMYAMKSSGESTMQRLLDLAVGADIDARKREGYTALHLAAAQGRDKPMRCLLHHGADCTGFRCSGCWQTAGKWIIQGCITLEMPFLLLGVRNYAVAHGLAGELQSTGLGEQMMTATTTSQFEVRPDSPVAQAAALPRWVVDPSPLEFLWLSVLAALLMRIYSYLNRPNKFQIWFVTVGLVCWPVIGTATGLNLLAGSLCIMPWTAFIGLLASNAAQLALRTMARKQPVVMFSVGTQDGGHHASSQAGAKAPESWNHEKDMHSFV